MNLTEQKQFDVLLAKFIGHLVLEGYVGDQIEEILLKKTRETTVSPDYDHCHVCAEKYVTSCRCPRGDRSCGNGHDWHTCIIHGLRVNNGSVHSSSGCSCGIGGPKTEDKETVKEREYEIVTSRSAPELEVEVREYLEKGYDLQGGVAVAWEENDAVYLQVMTKNNG